MQTVTFECGQCGNLMAVSTDYLGQQVRCPHCQQVVLAPTPAPAASPFSTLADPSPGPGAESGPQSPDLFRAVTHLPEEDIFTPPVQDALFGPTDAPRLEIPRDAAPAPDPDLAALAPPIRVEPPSPSEPTLSFANNFSDPSGADLPLESISSGPLGANHRTEEPLLSAPAPAPIQESLTTPTRRPPRRDRSRGLGGLAVVLLVIVPLILYSIMVTVAAALLYTQKKAAPPSPFEAYPDVTGDNPGVRPGKTKAELNLSVKSATAKLPDHLLVPLGQTLLLGDLEVTPKRVERRVVSIFVEGFAQAEPCPHESLVLFLHLRNRSPKWAFTPLDNYFDRKWKPKQGGSPPLTILEFGSEKVFGGPAAWFSRSSPKDGKRREWVQGRKNFDPEGLAPGEEMESLVCTDGSDPETALHLFGRAGTRTGEPHRGKLLWRVHLRRGVILHQGREVPVTTVVGVEFTDKDYRKEA
jgi:DNA-directed RNA polymerase subunit RPC12/RpoP